MVNVAPRPLLPQEKRAGTHRTGGGVSRKAGLDGCGKSRRPPIGIRSLDGQARSESLCWLRYLGFVCNVTYLMRSARSIMLAYLVFYHCSTTKLFVFSAQTVSVSQWRNVRVNRWVRLTLWPLAFCVCNIFSNKNNIPSHPSIVHFCHDCYVV
jgi:hypothetical protein